MANRWQMQGSWVISKIEGNYNNTSGNAGNSTPEYNDPNTRRSFPAVPRRPADERQHARRQGASDYRAPFGIVASGVFSFTSGQTFTRTVRTAARRPGTIGHVHRAARQPALRHQPQFNFKLEKQFRFGGTGASASRSKASTSSTTQLSTLAARVRESSYFEPRGVVVPRRFRIGAVYRF